MLLRQKHTNAINMAALYSSLNRKQKAQSLPAFILPANKERNSNNRGRSRRQRRTNGKQTRQTLYLSSLLKYQHIVYTIYGIMHR